MPASPRLTGVVAARVASTRAVAPTYHVTRLRVPRELARFVPGQFVMLRTGAAHDPLLPRPYSIYRAGGRPGGRDGYLDVLYRVVGRGTAGLAAVGPGRAVQLLGPLGRGFTRPDPAGAAVLVAGGVGVPPIAALARALAGRAGERPGRGRRPPVLAFVGGRSRADILGAADFRASGAALHVSTEDGSRGHRGLVTELLAAQLDRLAAERGAPRPTIFACGPAGMLRAVAGLAAAHGLACQVSLEEHMACGFGACVGCVVEMRPRAEGAEGPRYRLACTDGPVFDAEEVAW
jgi:dihydroorotate dehydrogenase electron transfer subunit